MLYTKSAAARILDIPVSRILKLTEAGGSYAVSYKAGRGRKGCTFVGKRAFQSDFVSLRREGAKSVHVYAYAGNWIAEGGLDDYAVDLHSSTAPICTCQDFHYQVEAGLPRQCCKHIYAVLFHLGFASLRDWVERTEVAQPQAA